MNSVQVEYLQLYNLLQDGKSVQYSAIADLKV